MARPLRIDYPGALYHAPKGVMPSGEGAEGDGVKGGVGVLAAEADEGIVCLVAFESIGRQ